MFRGASKGGSAGATAAGPLILPRAASATRRAWTMGAAWAGSWLGMRDPNPVGHPAGHCRLRELSAMSFGVLQPSCTRWVQDFFRPLHMYSTGTLQIPAMEIAINMGHLHPNSSFLAWGACDSIFVQLLHVACSFGSSTRIDDEVRITIQQQAVVGPATVENHILSRPPAGKPSPKAERQGNKALCTESREVDGAQCAEDRDSHGAGPDGLATTAVVFYMLSCLLAPMLTGDQLWLQATRERL